MTDKEARYYIDSCSIKGTVVIQDGHPLKEEIEQRIKEKNHRYIPEFQEDDYEDESDQIMYDILRRFERKKTSSYNIEKMVGIHPNARGIIDQHNINQIKPLGISAEEAQCYCLGIGGVSTTISKCISCNHFVKNRREKGFSSGCIKNMKEQNPFNCYTISCRLVCGFLENPVVYKLSDGTNVCSGFCNGTDAYEENCSKCDKYILHYEEGRLIRKEAIEKKNPDKVKFLIQMIEDLGYSIS